MSTEAGRWRLRIDIHLDVAQGEDEDALLRDLALVLEKLLVKRKARCGAYSFQHEDTIKSARARR